MLSASFLAGRRVHLERKHTKVQTEIGELEDRLRSGLARHDEAYLLTLKREILSRIDAAMRRINDGSYGLCLRCHQPIPDARLERMPDAPICVSCSTRRQSC